jgi:hypothetical protein
MIETYIDHLTDFSLWGTQQWGELAAVVVAATVIVSWLVWLGRRWIAEVVEREMYLRGDGGVL